MTLQAAYGLALPNLEYVGALGLAQAIGSQVLDASGEQSAQMFRCPKAGNIARIIFRTGAVTTGGEVRVSLQDLDPATGLPDGGVDHFRLVTLLNTDDNVPIRTGLITDDGSDTGALRTVAAGDALAVVIDFATFGSQQLMIAVAPGLGTRGPWLGSSYTALFTASWAKNTAQGVILGVEYDDGSFAFAPGVMPISAVGTQSMSTSTTPDEAGLLMTIPFACRVWGAWYGVTPSGDFDVVLYDSGGSVIGSASADKDFVGVSGAPVYGSAQFAAAPVLAAGAQVRLVIKPTTTTALALAHFDVERVGCWDQLDGGQAIHWTQRTDAGAWSQTTTRRASMGLLFSALDDGVSAGGGGRRPRMRLSA